MTIKKRVETLESTNPDPSLSMPIGIFEFDGKDYYDTHGNLANEAYKEHCKKVSEHIKKFGASKQISTIIVNLKKD